MKSFGLGKIFATVFKVILMGSIFIVVGLPLVAGYGVYFLTIAVHVGSQFFLVALGKPIVLGIVGAIALFLIRRRMKRNKA